MTMNILTTSDVVKYSLSPHPLLNTPPTFDKKLDYKGDTHEETPDSSTKYTNWLIGCE